MNLIKKINYLINSFIEWLRPSFEGEDGKASHRKLSVFYFSLLILYMLVATASGSIFPEIAWIVVSGGAGLFSALNVWQNKVKHQNDHNEKEE